jgi:hypothetical protein
MSRRLDQEREDTLTPKRFEYAISNIERLGYKVKVGATEISFNFLGNEITFFPYSGWASGKGINDGRGIKNLLKQIR